MSHPPDDTPAKKSSPGRIVLMGAVATGLAVFNMATNGPEAPSQALVILDWFFLACGVVALGGGLVMMLQGKA
jgi:hypothetical protein